MAYSVDGLHIFGIGCTIHSCYSTKQGGVVRKPVSANPGLKVNRILKFCSIKEKWYMYVTNEYLFE